MTNTVKYTSDNGYTGVMYSKSSYAVFDKDGIEVMHTGFRNFNTYDELVEHVEKYPKLMEMLRRATHILNDDESENDI